MAIFYIKVNFDIYFSYMAFFELIVILIKAVFLSAIYTTAVFVVVLVLCKTLRLHWASVLVRNWLAFWLVTHFSIVVLLFVLSFSYGQDTGLGDNSRIPVGYGQTIQNEDFAWTYFFPDPSRTQHNRDELIIEEYQIRNQFLCAEVSHMNTVSPSYDFIVYDLEKKHLRSFYTKDEYVKYALQHSLPGLNEFYDFEKHYFDFLNSQPKWRSLVFLW